MMIRSETENYSVVAVSSRAHNFMGRPNWRDLAATLEAQSGAPQTEPF